MNSPDIIWTKVKTKIMEILKANGISNHTDINDSLISIFTSWGVSIIQDSDPN